MKVKLIGIGLTLLLALLVACSGETEPAAPAVSDADTAAEGNVEQPTPAPTATRFDKAAIPVGQTAEGAFFIGREDAPVTMIDYSNFL